MISAKTKAVVPSGVVLCSIVLGLGLLAPLGIAWQQALVLGLTWAVAAVALDLWQGTLGELSFGHVAFTAVGGYLYVIGGLNLGLPIVPAAALALLGTYAVAVVVAQAVARLGHAGSAVTTLFLAFVVTNLAGSKLLRGLTHGENGLMVPFSRLGPISLLEPRVQLVLVSVCLVVTVMLCDRYRRGRAGRALSMVKRSELAAASLGIDVRSTKTHAFAFTAVFSGLAGILLVTTVGFVTPGMFPPTASVLLVAMIVVGGSGRTAGPILGAGLLALLPVLLHGVQGRQDLFAAIVFLAFLVFLPSGLLGVRTRLLPTARVRTARGIGAATTEPDLDRQSARRNLGIQVIDLEVTFGAVQALRGVSIDVEAGAVHAIVGANGAGKTTLLNVLSGAQPASAGSCVIGGTDCGGRSAREIRSLGLARTFQHPALASDRTAAENVALGLHYSQSWSLTRDLLGPYGGGRRGRLVRQRSAAILELVGIPAERHDVLESALSLAEQKLVDIARALVDDASVVLLDEPTAGLSLEEMDRLRVCLERIHTLTGVTMVIVGHHVEFLTALANRMTVLNAGEVVAEGKPPEVLARADVRDAFLGAAPAEAAR